MTYLTLFLGLSFVVTNLLVIVQWSKKRLKPGLLLGLFLFGILLSIPFVIVEHMSAHLKYYIIILAFIGIELCAILIEKKWKYLHHLIHHNVKNLKILSYFVISIGFTYSELAFYILSSHDSMHEIITTLPLKTLFALFIHTVLTSSTALINATESLFKHLFLFIINYLRLVFISVSHFIYLFISEHHAMWLVIPFLTLNMILFFKHKQYLDDKKVKVYF